MTDRRCFLASLVATLAAASIPAVGQPPGKVRRIGALVPQRRQEVQENIAHLNRGLQDLGWVEGPNLRVEWRFADGKYERLPDLAKELVASGAELIVSVGGSPSAMAAQGASRTLPIVFVNVGDPVALGLVDSLSHPGRNATGLTNLTADTVVKHLEMLRSLVPGLAKVAVFWNPATPMSPKTLKALETAAAESGTKVRPFATRTPEDISDAFSRMKADRPGALVLTGDSFLQQSRGLIADQALALRLPSIGPHVQFADAGGLLTYGANPAESYTRAAGLVYRILRGAKPADLPVEQPTKLQFVINRKTAKAIGVTIPPDLLLLADRVIE